MPACFFVSDTGKCELREREPKMGCAKRLKNDACGLIIERTYTPAPVSGHPDPGQETGTARSEQTDQSALL